MTKAQVESFMEWLEEKYREKVIEDTLWLLHNCGGLKWE